jgi:hypothetical protein
MNDSRSQSPTISKSMFSECCHSWSKTKEMKRRQGKADEAQTLFLTSLKATA